VLHGLAFIAFGVIAASLMAMSDREPALFIGFIILFACFEAFFFAMVQVFGLSKTGELTWWSVLVGNLLASVAMLWYFFRAHRALPQSLVGSWAPWSARACWPASSGRPWSRSVLRHRRDPRRDAAHADAAGQRAAAAADAAGRVLSYTVLHGVAFVLFGIIAPSSSPAPSGSRC